MTLHDLEVTTLQGQTTTLGALVAGGPALVVNVASKCGLTPQYAGLQALHERLNPRGLTVVGVPCNQFLEQEPGSAQEIEQFCSTTYGVTFPLLAKSDVNGPDRSALFDALTRLPDAEGQAGDVQWNFEKFLLDRNGEPVARFRPRTEPDDPALMARVEQELA